MNRLPTVRELAASSVGWGFFLCARKEVRTGRNGDFLSLVLHDVSGQVAAKLFDQVDRFRDEFEEGEFVKVQGKGNLYNGRLELVIERIRRVNPAQDRGEGFREEDCIPCAPRPAADMWSDLEALVSQVARPPLRALLDGLLREHRERLQLWPAAQTIHHAYRGGLLEHILQIARVALQVAEAYDADRDLLVAGAVLHDIGKLQELEYDLTTRYSRDGNLVGHIALGVVMLRDAAGAVPDFPADLRVLLEHLIVSHHGSRELGSPVEPKTVEALILAMADDLDAKIHQIRRHIAEDESAGEFTSYHPRLKRVLLKPPCVR